ncbi:hypothetical protein PKOR_14885 [Pontibacter korlensis]|uniref:Secretion system C-terminal sorting domain-containing protein n=1 Tax=Pontibacter korlensis TaxID=400092 RepID=A0A0E3UY46_9BACT|nr:T9SS type A sorting domain-containing protein [Pontibacter korlensis]AKD04141.1 hypothetical protein PKOR_14885 [Pontibacter korlensis]
MFLLCFVLGIVSLAATPALAQTITQSPTGTVCPGTVVTFTFTPPANTESVQWQERAAGAAFPTNIDGETGYTYSFPAETIDNGKRYSVLYTRRSGLLGLPYNTQSEEITLVVNAPAAPSVSHGSRQGEGPVTLAASGTPTGGSYRWYKVASGGSPDIEQTGAVYTTESISTTTSYWVSAVSAQGCEGPRTEVKATIYAEEFKVNNDAVADGSCYTLTPDAQNSKGEIWRTTPVDLNKSFDISFTANFGSNAAGADGIAFGFQRQSPDPMYAEGRDGEALGFGGISPSVVVEFDTYRNTGEPDYDHVAVFLNGNQNAPETGTQAQMSNTQTNVKDGKIHTVRINWTKELNKIEVFFDGVKRTEYTADIINTVFGGNPIVYFGFTASTGDLTNVQTVCDIEYNRDTDKDGVLDRLDEDDDNDGILDIVEGEGDKDGDGIPNSLDLDSDGDGILDAVEANNGIVPSTGFSLDLGHYTSADANGRVTGLTDSVTNPDTDGDGLKDYLDIDSDNDGIRDNIEAQPTVGRKMANGLDINRNGVDDAYDSSAGGTALRPVNTDGDRAPDYLDMDSDGDLMTDLEEAHDLNNDGKSLDDFLEIAQRFRQRANTASSSAASFYPEPAEGQTVPAWLEQEGEQTRVLNFQTYNNTHYHDSDSDGLIDLFDSDSFGEEPQVHNNAYREVGEITPLPVTLVAFTAQVQGRDVLLKWSTASEITNDYFAVERSSDGRSFEEIARVKGAGNSNVEQSYSLRDRKAPAGIQYYRLKQVDFDGDYEFSKVVAVHVQEVTTPLVTLFPNPSIGALNLDMTALPENTYQVSIIGLGGRVVMQTISYGGNVEKLDVSGLPKGKYVLRVQGESFVKTVNFIKQ